MKKLIINTHYSLLTTHYSLLTILLLLFSTCSQFTGSRADGSLSVEQSVSLCPDSLWTPTGDANLDSLLSLASSAPQDTNLVKLYDKIGDEYFYYQNDFPNAKEYYLKSKALTEKLNWNEGRYLFAASFTNLLDNEGLMDSSIVIHREVLKLAKEEAEENGARIAGVLANMGSSYYLKNWYETALEYYLQSLALFEKSGDEYRFAQVSDLVGVLYGDLDMYERQFEYYEKALDIMNRYPDTLQRAILLLNYATGLSSIYELEKAENYLMEAQRICLLNNNDYYLMMIYTNLADLGLRQHDFNKAELYTNKAMELNLKFGNIIDYCMSYRAYSYIEENKGNFNKSEEYVREALETAIEYDLPAEKMKCYQHLSNLATARQDFCNARLYAIKSDSIGNEMMVEKAMQYGAEMAAKYETKKKELEIEQKQQIIVRQRWSLIIGIAVSALILALLWVMLHLRNRKNQVLSEKNEILSEMNATKNKFFSIISHDLKNPALALHDALKMLLQNAHSWDVDALSKYCNELLKSSENQVELIFNLLSWAQIQTGRITFHPTSYFLPSLIHEIAIVGKMAEKKGITLEVSIPEDAVVTCDSNMIATVVRNLLTNAVKFTSSGGTVTLDVAPNTCKTLSAQTGYTISIFDTGTGMSKSQMHDLFRIDRFRSKKGTAGEQGSGLGLIICKEFLEKHGSELHVESEEGKGSRFWFEV